MGEEHDRTTSGEGGNGLPRILSVLELLTEEELVQLNHVVVQRIRLMQQIRAHNEMTRLRIGQIVTFTDSAGQLLRGTIARHNRKSVTIVTQCGQQWRVSPQFVQAGRGGEDVIREE
jgi:hypothetical protein